MNLKSIVKEALSSHNGQRALNKKPTRERDKAGKYNLIWRNASVAVALQDSLNG